MHHHQQHQVRPSLCSGPFSTLPRLLLLSLLPRQRQSPPGHPLLVDNCRPSLGFTSPRPCGNPGGRRLRSDHPGDRRTRSDPQVADGFDPTPQVADGFNPTTQGAGNFDSAALGPAGPDQVLQSGADFRLATPEPRCTPLAAGVDSRSVTQVDLTLEDVGRSIELVFTPVRKDGLRGPPKSIPSNVILPGDPKGIELVLSPCSQDNEVVPLRSYFGGREGTGKYIWYRTKDKLEESKFLNIATASKDFVIVGETLAYTPSVDDIDFYLTLCWVPMCDDGKHGDPLIARSNAPVMAASPIVSNEQTPPPDINTALKNDLKLHPLAMQQLMEESKMSSKKRKTRANILTAPVFTFKAQCGMALSMKMRLLILERPQHRLLPRHCH